MEESYFREVAHRLNDATRVTAITGAGVSAASGVPTFRGASGLWRAFRAEDLATPQAFRNDPRLVWEWYDWRRRLIAECSPNAAHEVLARWQQRPGFTLITQNVDGLHERAGSAEVIRFHGSIWQLRCASGCGQPNWEDRSVPIDPLPPRCPRCGNLARPDVVWFGEVIDADVLRRCERALACDLFLSIGTSSVVYPAAALLHVARANGAFTIEVNPETTPAAVDLAIPLGAEIALPEIDRALT